MDVAFVGPQQVRKRVSRSPGLRWLGATPDRHVVVALVRRHHPDIVVLDSVLDPHGGLIRLLAGYETAGAVVVLLREPHLSAQHVANTFAAGAHGVLLRSGSPDALIAGILETHHKRRYLDPALSQRIQHNAKTTRSYPLTDREHDTLYCVALAMGITAEPCART